MKHFVVYHNTEKMGYELKSSGQGVGFLTNKSLRFLEGVTGHKVWMITGAKGSRNKNCYHLFGYYIADEVKESTNSDFDYWIGGKQVELLKESEELNGFYWFWQLFRSQGSFAFGLREIKDKEVVAALEGLAE